jgi:hypothetical protein
LEKRIRKSTQINLQQINSTKKNSYEKNEVAIAKNLKILYINLLKIDLIWNKNLTTTFIQLLRTKKIKNKIKNKYSEKNHEKRRKKKNLTLM